MGKSKGGQPKHWAEKARVWAWYSEIRRRPGWNDYWLDHEFAWTEEGKKSRKSDNRPRTFEWIRKVARQPRGRDERWHDMSGLVTAVDQHPQFAGTRKLYESAIWDMFQENTPKPEAVQRRIVKLMADNNLVLAHPSKLFTPGNKWQSLSDATLFDRCLELSLREMDRLCGLELVWSLYVLTESADKWPIRERIELIADRLLDEFFANYLSDREPLVYYDMAIRSLQQTHMDFSSRNVGGYRDINAMTKWPIVPETLVGHLTEQELIMSNSILLFRKS